MKTIIAIWAVITFQILFFPAQAQEGPDRLPLPSLTDAEYRGISEDSVQEIEINDSLLSPNVLRFCGQEVNLDPAYRQRKLRRELIALRRVSSALLQRSEFFFPFVEHILWEENVPDDFKYLMVVESGMNPSARSPVGALGLWQFMEGTAREYGLIVNQKLDERLNIEKSTRAACRLLKDAYDKFGDWVAVAQSYNIGQNRINNELKRQKVEDAIDLELVEETNRYIYRIMAVKIIFTHPANFGLTSPMPYYKKIRRN
ncbi:lytic transglycosylase domain-containing protein [uncultured Bacteroides sp.]|uniref:lytic transglycosylase domain-containing protein n=1 Tax=uncultured Bacteroides sp. TaxID=162156 RepID=UPI00261F58AF|nr:lytic transglycosylase domain-containing protein [uncultured Bacteroides sp.]